MTVGAGGQAFAWLGPAPEAPTVGLVVQASYHLEEFEPLRDELEGRGLAAQLVVAVPPSKPLNRFRPGVRRFRELLAAAGVDPGESVGAESLAGRLRAVVVMNDWGMPAPLVEQLRRLERPTFGWVEGVQDWDDVDTGQRRRPYSAVDHVFCLGRDSAGHLAGRPSTIVGSERLRRLWEAPPVTPRRRHVTVNSNFTYGVLSDSRRPWLTSAARACRTAGADWTLSRHTAERGLAVPHRASRDPIADLLDRSTHLVSRFSTVCYEALVRGVELAYHNPHGETVATFAEPEGAFAITRDAAELAAVLGGPIRGREVVRQGAAAFLSEHVRLEPGPTPAALAAEVIVAALR